MYVYYITIVASIITSYLAQITGSERRIDNIEKIEYNSFFVLFTGTVLVFVAGLRWQVGTDYWQYSLNYNRYAMNLWPNIVNFSEPGINFIAKMSSLIYDDYATMFFISSLLTVGLTVKTIAKYSNMLTFSLLLYIFIGSWHGSFNGVRQYLASAIIFAGHHYIINRKFKQYLVVVLIASTFHITALGMILLYFIPIRRLKIKQLLVLAVISLLLTFSYDFLFSIMGTIRGREFDGIAYFTREVNTFRILIAFAPLMIYAFLTNKDKYTNYDYFYTNMLFVNAALTYATSNSAYLMRYVIYTNIFMTLGIPKLYNFNDKTIKFIIKSVTIVLFFIFWYIEVSKSGSLNSYKWIFQR